MLDGTLQQTEAELLLSQRAFRAGYREPAQIVAAEVGNHAHVFTSGGRRTEYRDPRAVLEETHTGRIVHRWYREVIGPDHRTQVVHRERPEAFTKVCTRTDAFAASRTCF